MPSLTLVLPRGDWSLCHGRWQGVVCLYGDHGSAVVFCVPDGRVTARSAPHRDLVPANI